MGKQLSVNFPTYTRSARRRVGDGTTVGRDAGSQGSLLRVTAQAMLIAMGSAGLYWLVWIYANGLRDPRYLDGWVLAAGMGAQLGFHIAVKSARLSPRSATRWRKLHILLGYLLVAAFVSHSDFSLPDTGFEWALWTCFVLVTATGIFGTYLAWSLQAKRRTDELTGYDRIATRRAELAEEMRATVTRTEPAAVAVDLPSPPYDAWIMDLYTAQLRDFFDRPHHAVAHLIGSEHPLKRLTDEIDNLSRYVDKPHQEKLAVIRTLVVEKGRLDFARVFHGLTRGWLLLHVPVTYALIVLSVVHVVVVYAFSSGAW